MPTRRLPLAATVPLVTLAALNLAGALALIPDRGGDFFFLYDRALAWRQGGSYYASPAGMVFTNLNHPATALAFVPFTWLSKPVALTIWSTLALGALAWAARIVARSSGLTVGAVGLLTLASTGGALALQLGQVSYVLLLVPFTLAWRADREGRPVAAGLALGVLCALKPFYGLLVLSALWRRRWTMLLSLLASGAAVMGLGWLTMGLSGYHGWVSSLGGVSWQGHLGNASVWGTSARLFSATTRAVAAGWTPIVIAPRLAFAAGAIATLIVLALVWASRSHDTDRSYTLFSLGALLISPLGWTYYLPVALGPILTTIVRRTSSTSLWIVGALVIYPHAFLVNHRYGLVGTMVAGQVALASIVGLWWLAYTAPDAVVDAERSGRERPATSLEPWGGTVSRGI